MFHRLFELIFIQTSINLLNFKACKFHETSHLEYTLSILTSPSKPMTFSMIVYLECWGWEKIVFLYLSCLLPLPSLPLLLCLCPLPCTLSHYSVLDDHRWCFSCLLNITPIQIPFSYSITLSRQSINLVKNVPNQSIKLYYLADCHLMLTTIDLPVISLYFLF